AFVHLTDSFLADALEGRPVEPRRRRRTGRSWRQPVGRSSARRGSADQLMTEPLRGVYREPVNARVPGLRRLRLDPLKLDFAVAVVLTLVLELEVWLGGGASGERLVVALAGALTTAMVAFRRLYPTTAGVSVGLLSALVAAVWGPPSIVTYGIAWMCA